MNDKLGWTGVIVAMAMIVFAIAWPRSEQLRVLPPCMALRWLDEETPGPPILTCVWSPPPDTEGIVGWYRIYGSVGDDTTYTLFGTSLDTLFSFEAEYGTTYRVRISAVNPDTLEGEWSGASRDTTL